MPFSLKNARATYQREMNSMFHDFIEDFMQVYIDDIVIKSNSKSTHLQHLQKYFERMSVIPQNLPSFLSRQSMALYSRIPQSGHHIS